MKIEPAHAGHIKAIEATLRDDDRTELALSGGSVWEAAQASDFTEAVSTDTGLPLALWGVADHANHGSIWMLCSRAVESHSTQFLRACPPLVERAHERFEHLICAPWRGNALHFRWLKWLGFVPGAEYGELLIHHHVLSTPDSPADAGSVSGRGLRPEAGQ